MRCAREWRSVPATLLAFILFYLVLFLTIWSPPFQSLTRLLLVPHNPFHVNYQPSYTALHLPYHLPLSSPRRYLVMAGQVERALELCESGLQGATLDEEVVELMTPGKDKGTAEER